MKKIWLLLCAEAARWKTRKNIVKIAVLIVVIISTFSYVRLQKGPEKEILGISLGIAKEDTSAYADLLMEYFSGNEEFTKYVTLKEAKREVLEQEVLLGSLDGYLVIPENFAESMLVMENLPMEAVVAMNSPLKALVLKHTMSAYATYIEAVEANCMALYDYMKENGFSYEERIAANTDISLELIFTALGKNNFFRTRTLEQTETVPVTTHYLLNAMYFVLVFFLLSAGIRMSELKQSAMLVRVKSMGIGTGHVMTAVMLPYVIFISAVSGGLCFGFEQRAMSTVIYVCFSLIVWLALFVVLGGCMSSRRELLFVCSLSIVVVAILGGALLPEQFLPDEFLRFTRWMPNRNFVHLLAGL